MRILITNDDGIDADGLLRLVRAAADMGEVWVVAPDGQRSASSHSIAIRDAIDIFPYTYPVKGVTAYACSGTPADCVRALPSRPHFRAVMPSPFLRRPCTAMR